MPEEVTFDDIEITPEMEEELSAMGEGSDEKEE